MSMFMQLTIPITLKIRRKKKMIHIYLCQHDYYKVAFSNFIFFECCPIFKYLPLVDKHLLGSRIYIWTLNCFYVLLHIGNLKNTENSSREFNVLHDLKFHCDKITRAKISKISSIQLKILVQKFGRERVIRVTKSEKSKKGG